MDRIFKKFHLFFFDVFWARALPAALFEDLLVLPSRKTDEALLATFLDVVFLGAFVWLSALPAAALDFFPVLFDRRTFEALWGGLLSSCVIPFVFKSFNSHVTINTNT